MRLALVVILGVLFAGCGSVETQKQQEVPEGFNNIYRLTTG